MLEKIETGQNIIPKSVKITFVYKNKFSFVLEVKGVFDCLKEMIDEIKTDQKSNAKTEEPLAMNFIIDTTVGAHADQSVTELNGEFVHFSLLIDVLIRCKTTAIDKLNLIQRCKEHYKDDQTELDIIDEFNRQYSADKALWWYTRDSFLYRMLNKALRVENIGLLFLFRHVIADIYERLQRYQYRKALTVYRGQIMSKNEREKHQKSINKFLSINSFFSTSRDRECALKFLNKTVTTDDLERVLFAIDADPNGVKSKPFAELRTLSYYEDENEVLFMIGSVFQLNSIHWDNEERAWIINMVLCNEDTYDSKQLLDHIRKQHGINEGEINLRQFGDVLHTMGKYNLAEDIYKRVLDEPQHNELSRVYLYRSYGILMKIKAEFNNSLNWFHAALDLQLRICPSDYTEISESYNWLGKVYYDQNKCKAALEHYLKAFDYLNKAFDDEIHLKFANIFNNIAGVHGRQKRTDEALEYYRKALVLYQQYLPSKHSTTALCYNNIGNVYMDKKNYDEAMKYFDKALTISLESLPSQHPNIAVCYQSIGRAREKQDQLQEALDYYLKAADIYHHSLPSDHPKVINIDADVQRILIKQSPSSRLNPIHLFRRSFSLQ